MYSTRRRLLVLVVLASLGPVACDLPGVSRADRARRRFPRIVLVSFDTLHVGYTDPYQPGVGLTPHLETFAREGVVFDQAHTRVPLTLPSHTAILTGRSPIETGVMLNGDSVPGALPTWAELLQERGWTTGAFVSLGVLKARLGLARGFDTYDDRIDEVLPRWYLTGTEVIERVRPWVDAHRDEPFFLWVHLSDPHHPYLPDDPPPDARLSLDGEALGAWSLTDAAPYRVRFELPPGRHRLRWESLRPRHPADPHSTGLRVRIRNPEALRPFAEDPPTPLDEELRIRYPWEVELVHRGAAPTTLELRFDGRLNNPPRAESEARYRDEVTYADRCFGELRRWFRERGLEEDTLWIVVSDHGEGLLRERGHARWAFEAQLRAMWMMAGPGLPAGRRIGGSTPVLLEDVLPTVLEHLGLPVPEDLDGMSQRGCWLGQGCRARTEWWGYGADVESEEILAVAGYRWPYKASWHERRRPRRERRLHHLAEDPWEHLNLVSGPGDAPPTAVGETLLRRLHRQRAILQRRLDERRRTLDDEDREMLEALGYL